MKSTTLPLIRNLYAFLACYLLSSALFCLGSITNLTGIFHLGLSKSERFGMQSAAIWIVTFLILLTTVYLAVEIDYQSRAKQHQNLIPQSSISFNMIWSFLHITVFTYACILILIFFISIQPIVSIPFLLLSYAIILILTYKILIQDYHNRRANLFFWTVMPMFTLAINVVHNKMMFRWPFILDLMLWPIAIVGLTN
jgi:hypothetical protein